MTTDPTGPTMAQLQALGEQIDDLLAAHRAAVQTQLGPIWRQLQAAATEFSRRYVALGQALEVNHPYYNSSKEPLCGSTTAPPETPQKAP